MIKRLGVLGWPVAHSRSPAIATALASLGVANDAASACQFPPQLFAQAARWGSTR